MHASTRRIASPSIVCCLLATTAGPLAGQDYDSCPAIDLVHPDEYVYSGVYERTSAMVNGAPVYQRENHAVDAGSPYRQLYVFKFLAGSTAEGTSWVMQPLPPEPSRWQADSEGKGATPWTATWRRQGMTVQCRQATKRNVPESSNEIVDLAVFYTADAVEAVSGTDGSMSALRNGLVDLIKRRVNALNTVFGSSGQPYRIRLVHLSQTELDEEEYGNVNPALLKANPYTVVNRMIAELSGTEVSMPTVKAYNEIRDKARAVQADLVHLVVARTGGDICGIGKPVIEPAGESTVTGSMGYSLTKVRCISHEFGLYSMAHEIGHNFGLQHDKASIVRVEGSSRVFAPSEYAFGYLNRDQLIHTIMAYSGTCNDCKVKPYWSSPEPVRDCTPQGVCTTLKIGLSGNDNRRKLAETFGTIAMLSPAAGPTAMLAPSERSLRAPIGARTPGSFEFFNLRDWDVTVEAVSPSTWDVHLHRADEDDAGECAVGRTVPALGSCTVYYDVLPRSADGTRKDGTIRVTLADGITADFGFSYLPYQR